MIVQGFRWRRILLLRILPLRKRRVLVCRGDPERGVRWKNLEMEERVGAYRPHADRVTIGV